MTKKTLIKVGIIIIITCVMCFSDWSFAAEWNNFDVMWFSLNYIVAVLSWIWILFAKLAGTFLTNNWVYGEILWLDALMRRFWNVMKNIANFWLWFYFVYVIFKWLISSKEDITQTLKKIIVWLLIAWIGIQASRFFTAAIIDVSTITLSAVGAFPSQVISSSPYVKWSLEMSMPEYLNPSFNYVETGTEYTLFSKNWDKSNLLESTNVQLLHPQTLSGLVDSLMPNADDVSWPMYYIWFSILKTNVLTSIDTSSEKWIKATILNTIIQWWTTIIFSIEMMVLCVLAIMRIIYLWMFIILSPIAILLWCIEKSWQKLWSDDKSFLAKFTKQINFKSFFINVFKPTIIVLWFWIAVLFVSLMNRVVLDSWKRSIDLGWAIITSTANGHLNSGKEWDNTYTTKIDNNLISFTLANTWKTFLEIILSIITVLIVYFILKFAVKFGEWKDFVSKKIWKVQDEVKSLMEMTPVMPVAGYDKEGRPVTRYLNAGQVFGLWNKDSLLGEKINRYGRKIQDKYRESDDIVRSWFGDNTGSLSETEKHAIENAGIGKHWIEILEDKKAKISKTEEWKWMTLNPQTASNDGFWIEQFKNWLNNVKENDLSKGSVRQSMARTWQNWDEKDRSLDKLFTRNLKYVQAYANYFFDEGDDRRNISEWSVLKNEDISKKKKTKDESGEKSE